MARSRGSFNFAQNFEVQRAAPLDARQKVGYYTDLVDPSAWISTDGYVWLYNGAMVVVTEDPSSGLYILKDGGNYTNYNSWYAVGGGATPLDPSALQEVYSYIDGSLAAIDSSITDIYAQIDIIDSSISYLVNWNTIQDASILALDSSIRDLWARTVLNIGDGSANIFAGYDSSNNIQLRTLSSAGAATVTEIGGQIIIGLDASFSGEVNYGVNVGSGDASIYVQKVGDALEFREIKGQGSILVSTSDNLILIDSSGGGTPTYDTALDSSLAMPSTVGGIPFGTLVNDLKGDTLIKMWDDLLFPTANPVLTAPSGSFSMSPTTTLYEVGSNATLTFTTTLNRGSINPQYTADSPYRSGLPNNFDFTGIGLVDISSNSIPYVHPAIDVSILIGNQSWSAAIGYDGGVQPYDNKGNVYDSSLAAGSLSASPTRTIEGVYPLFATTVDISTLVKQSLLPMSTTTTPGYTVVTETGGYKQKFDIPDKWTGAPTNNPLTAIQQYNTFSSQWETISLSTWTTSSTTHTIQGIVENYTRYTYNGVDRSSVQIRMIF